VESCALDLAGRFRHLRPTKVLTVATTGLILGIPMARILSVPAVYARKSRSVVMRDSYHKTYASKSHGSSMEVFVSKGHLSADDRILVVDDWLSSGACQEALLSIISDVGAETVGVAVLLEKGYESGRTFLSGYDVPIESVVSVRTVSEGTIDVETGDE